MQKITTNWVAVLTRIKSETGQSMMETLRSVGISGSAAIGITQQKRQSELKHSEGVALQTIWQDLFSEPMPTKSRPDQQKCASCQNSRDIEDIYRVSEKDYKCGRCIENINKQYQRQYSLREKERKASIHQ